MNKRFIKIIVLIAIVILIGITLYRFADNLGKSYQQLGIAETKRIGR